MTVKYLNEQECNVIFLLTRNDSRSAYENKHNDDKRRKHKDVDRRDRNDDRAHDYRNKSKERDNYHHQRDRGRDYRQNNYRNRYGNNENDDYRRNRREDQYSRNRRGRSRSRSFDHANAKWGKEDKGRDKSGKDKDKEVKKEKEKPNFGLSGKLTEETNTYRGVVIKYSEPPEARKPKRRWRLYPFKGDKALQTLYIHRESAYLIGRDRKVVDLPVDHPSCSKQHAALQYRLVTFTREDGTTGKRVRPYLIDLESANGTFINNKKIEAKKYVELLERDVIKFGFSSREYVLLHENSKDEAQDDDVKIEEEVPVKKESNE
ncbi:hypothetical protein PPYR_03934 [Photinus pyralis]|uniref:FHA domain-containing protein n=1 Tax=Photinus pyralis TaxID=7054 RepID=A0A5N4AWX8_PHOPY|nr:smad nuclear-interacting protein 1 isoform X2 [Photinus pyralis]KAB0801748.1 hypothetical protein PPYR_03934 [Photinus pyralis]